MILPRQDLLAVMQGRKPIIHFIGENEDLERFVQPASVDLPLGNWVYRMGASALPESGQRMEELISRFSQYDFELQRGGSVFERGTCYLVPLDVRLNLHRDWRAVFSPKSSTGRNDLFVRVLADGVPRYDEVAGDSICRLYLEIIPLSYSVKLAPGDCLTQMRIRTKNGSLIGREVRVLHSRFGIVRNNAGEVFANDKTEIDADGNLFLHVDLARPVIGFESMSNSQEMIWPTIKEKHSPETCWRPLKARNRELVLEPGHFYLLTTREKVLIPPSVCGEVVAYDVATGEFRSHYAGFFDNGFGGTIGTNAVLEVRVRDVPFRLFDGQPICCMRFFNTNAVPDRLYTGNYLQSGPSLAKNFQRRYEVWEES